MGLRRPETADASEVWRLIRRTDTLDLNSPYAYLLLCSDFAATSVVAHLGDDIVGFVGGYRPPDRPRAVFVWQIVVADQLRGYGLGLHMLAMLADTCAGVDTIEATVTPSNAASHALFTAFARRRGASIREQIAYAAELFPDSHEPEMRLIIGPIKSVESTKGGKD